MPQKKRSHGRHKTTTEPKEHGKADACPVEVQLSTKSSALYPTARSNYGKSQPGQTPPKPAAQVSAVKPAQSESASSGSTMATKPGVVTTTTGGSATVGAAGKETPKAKPETNTALAGAAVNDMSSAEASGSTKVVLKTAPSSQDKVTPKVPPAAGTAAASSVTAPKESHKDTAKSTTASTAVKADAPKVDPAKTSKPAAAGVAAPGKVSVEGKKEEVKTAQTKVQAAVTSTAAKGTKEGPAVDPIDELADILPSADPVRPDPVYTGQEVRERDITSEKAQKCGERDDTLPPGYRFENLGPAPADAKPAADSKPISTDEALDSLSAGFTLAAPDKQTAHVENIGASTAAHTNFAPPPVKKAETPAAVPPTAALPADKKAKMEKVSAESISKKADSPVAAPPADKKAKMDKTTPDVSHKAGVDTKAGAQPKTEAGDSMSLDALSALGDTLPANIPKPESPKLKPKDIVSEGKAKKEKGVRVGERDDTLPPEYRFKEEDLKKLPPPTPEPKMDTDDALAILSGDFSTDSAAPPVQAPVVCSSAAPAQKSPAPPADKKAKAAQASGLSLEAGLSATTAKKVESAAAPPVARPPAPSAEKKAEAHKPAAGKDTKPKTDQVDSMSLDALSALGDTLPADVPKPESPKLKPKDIVSEDKVKKEKGVRVGERDDTLPPEYRFKEEDLVKLPPPTPEPKMDTDDALDILSGDFSSDSAAPPVQAPVVCSSAPPVQTKPEDLSALDVLSKDIVSSSKASGVKASVPPPSKKPPQKAVCPLEQHKTPEEKPQQTKPKIEKGDSMSLDALNALGDTLPADVPKPESPKLRPEDLVSEGKVKEEKGVLVGERDDTLPPEYRFKEEDLKKLPASKPEKMAEAKEKTPKEKAMDDKTALEMLSSDFSAAPKPAALATSSAATTKLEPPVLDSKPLKPMAGPVLDSLADTLVPGAIQAKSKTDKPKKPQTEEPSATDQVAAKQSSDVVPTSTKKGAKS